MPTCYRHPSRETGVSCSSCGRPICTDCMTTTSVGMRCPDCARQKTPVHTLRTMRTVPRVTYALIAINVLVFLIAGNYTINGGAGGSIVANGYISRLTVANGDYYRLITNAFLHENLLHVAFNMYLLYLLGMMLEPALGSLKFGAIYVVSLLAGSFGALVATAGPSLGASGAVFGLMGAAAVEVRARGMNPLQTGIGALIIINLVFSFTFPNISYGAHIGGLIGGALAALVIQAGDRRRSLALGMAGCVLLCAVSVVGAVAVAGSPQTVGVGP